MPYIYKEKKQISANFVGKLLIVLAALSALFASCNYAHAQTSCPENMVCITKAAAQAALEAGDKAKALEAEAKVKDKAIDDLKTELNNMRVQFAEMSGESTILKQRAVSDAAMIQLLMQNVKKKRNAFITIF